MTLRAGMYDASRPRFRGVIRNDSYPWYVCSEEHNDPDEARTCSRRALLEVKKLDPENKGLRTRDLPEGWHVFNRSYDGDL